MAHPAQDRAHMFLRRTGRCASLITGGSGTLPYVGTCNSREAFTDTRVALLLPAVLASRRPPRPPAIGVTLQYNRDVRPILAENCFPCHGPDSAARKADLRLDKRDAAIEAGAITPGDLEASELIARINAANPKEVMPAAVDHQDLEPEAERRAQAVDRRGHPYQLHWSFIPPARAGCRKSRIGPGPAIRSMSSCWPSSRKTA